MLRLIREHRKFFLATGLTGLALRLIFLAYFPMVTDDSHVYANIATNWLQYGIYGQTQTVENVTQIEPTDTRLPGYPAFLAGIFWIFGPGNYRAAMLVQILFDLATCLVVADLARRMASERAARIACVLAALCPFLANYAAAELTETLEVFFTALALDCAAAALQRMHEGGMQARTLWAATGVPIGACILLRPDGGLLLAAVVLYLAMAAANGTSGLVGCAASLQQRVDGKWKFFRNALGAAMIVIVVALAPLVPWTLRNFRTLHHFQPLAPRYANETDELAPRGFNRWVKTWIVDYVPVEEIYWNVPGDKINAEKLPSRAIESPAERVETLALIADYNQAQDLTPELDERFDRIASERIRAHPVRYYIVLPLLRIAAMWLRPRIEILPPDPRWWEFNDDTKHSVIAVGLGVLNLAYVVAALLALIAGTSPRLGKSRKGIEIRWSGLLVSFVLLRTAFLGTLENPEPRYTLECYPAIIVLASFFLARRNGTKTRSN